MGEGAARSGAAAMLDFAAASGIDCVFASPIAVLAPLWEAVAARPADAAPRYLNCRHELLAVSLASGYWKASGPALLDVFTYS